MDDSPMHPAFLPARPGGRVRFRLLSLTPSTWAGIRERLDSRERTFADAAGFEPKAGRHLLLPARGRRTRRGPVRARSQPTTRTRTCFGRARWRGCCRRAPTASPMLRMMPGSRRSPSRSARIASPAIASRSIRRSGSNCPAASTAPSSAASPRACGLPAISSTRRRTTWARPSSKRRRARWRPATAPERAHHRRRRPARAEFSAHPCGRPRRCPAAAPDRHQLGRSQPSQGDADRQGRLLRYRRARHQAGSGMLNMKKDMGGAATMLALAHMLMDRGAKLRLRVLIPAVENAISGVGVPPARHLPLAQGSDRRDRQHRRGRPADPGRRDCARRRGKARADRRYGDARPARRASRSAPRCRRSTPTMTRLALALARCAAGENDPFGGCRYGGLMISCSIPRSRTSTTSLPAILAARSPLRCFCAGS